MSNIREEIDKLLDFFTEPGKGEKYLADLADDLESLFDRHAEKRAAELIEKMYDPKDPGRTQGNVSNFLQGQAQLREPQDE